MGQHICRLIACGRPRFRLLLWKILTALFLFFYFACRHIQRYRILVLVESTEIGLYLPFWFGLPIELEPNGIPFGNNQTEVESNKYNLILVNWTRIRRWFLQRSDVRPSERPAPLRIIGTQSETPTKPLEDQSNIVQRWRRGALNRDPSSRNVLDSPTDDVTFSSLFPINFWIMFN